MYSGHCCTWHPDVVAAKVQPVDNDSILLCVDSHTSWSCIVCIPWQLTLQTQACWIKQIWVACSHYLDALSLHVTRANSQDLLVKDPQHDVPRLAKHFWGKTLRSTYLQDVYVSNDVKTSNKIYKLKMKILLQCSCMAVLSFMPWHKCLQAAYM